MCITLHIRMFAPYVASQRIESIFLCGAVCSLLELLSSSALESAASQAVLETLVQMLMLCSGQSPPDAEPDANSDAQPAPAPVSAAVAVAEGSSVGVPYVPYVPLVVEHTATQRAAGFVLLTLELKFLHLCASVLLHCVFLRRRIAFSTVSLYS